MTPFGIRPAARAQPEHAKLGGVKHSAAIIWVVVAAALLRLAHLASAMRSPFTYNPGPDEDFYLQFAAQVVEHGWNVPVEFGFMDPFYGYWVGVIFALTGGSLFAVYLLQVVIDLATTWLIYACARELGRPRAGLIAAGIYALCGTAILFTATALKPTWVACFVMTWTFVALRSARQPSLLTWTTLGLIGGAGVALRSNLVLMAPLLVLCLPLVAWRMGATWPRLRLRLAGLLAGHLIILTALAANNASAGLGWTPLPYNGGIVLHHLYNPENPHADSLYPEFVHHRHPLEILRGYQLEAERRLGKQLAPPELSRYWRGIAITYITKHPAQSAANAARKLKEFFASTEVPNNRSFAQEAAYSPVLRALPLPFAWLLALGLPGLVIMLRTERRGWLIVIPLVTCMTTMMIFFAESRFRFHAVPTLALAAGVFVDGSLRWAQQRQWKILAVAYAAAIAIACISVSVTRGMPTPGVDMSREAWGFIRMGDAQTAAELAQSNLDSDKPDAGMYEVLAFIASAEGDHPATVALLQEAIRFRPTNHIAHYNLALSLTALKQPEPAMGAINTAIASAPLSEYRLLKADLLAQSGDTIQAIAIYCSLITQARNEPKTDGLNVAETRLTAMDQDPRSCARD